MITAPEIKYEEDSFNECCYDANGKPWNVRVSWQAYHYDGSMRIVSLKVSTDFHNKDGSLAESVLELIKLREGRRVTMECVMDLVD